MDYLNKYWLLRLKNCEQALKRNHFDATVVESEAEACWQVLDLISSTLGNGESVGFGGSQTVLKSGVYEGLKTCKHLNVIDHFDKSLSREQALDLRKKAATAKLYLTGANAITETGMLVNLDMLGNRVAALTIGPQQVVVMAGRNKLVTNLEAAMSRIKKIAAPANAMCLGMETPCASTGYCSDCQSPNRICNVWTIHEKCFPAGRIKVFLINADLGL